MATYDQIRSKVYLLCKTNVTSLPNASLNLYTQPAEDRVVSLILHADAQWQFDDRNYSDLPIATTTITSGQQDYSLAVSHLTIDRARIKDSGGNWTILDPIDRRDLKTDYSISIFNGSGLPTHYDKMGSSVFLGPISNYTQAASLELTFTRGPLKFDYTDDKFTDDTGSASSSPGFNTLFHDLIPLWASFNYAIANGLK